jgi:hypothetical protein
MMSPTAIKVTTGGTLGTGRSVGGEAGSRVGLGSGVGSGSGTTSVTAAGADGPRGVAGVVVNGAGPPPGAPVRVVEQAARQIADTAARISLNIRSARRPRKLTNEPSQNRVIDNFDFKFKSERFAR